MLSRFFSAIGWNRDRCVNESMVVKKPIESSEKKKTTIIRSTCIPDTFKLYEREFDNKDIDMLNATEFKWGGTYTAEAIVARIKCASHLQMCEYFTKIYQDNLQAIFDKHYTYGKFTVYDGMCFDLNKINDRVGVEVSDEHIGDAKLLIEKYNRMDIAYSIQDRPQWGGSYWLDPIVREVRSVCGDIRIVFDRCFEVEYTITTFDLLKIINISIDRKLVDKAKEIMSKYVNTTSLTPIGWSITYNKIGMSIIGSDPTV